MTLQSWLGDLGSWTVSTHSLSKVDIIFIMMMITMTYDNDGDADDNDDDLVQMPGTGGGGEYGQREHFLIC